MGGGIVIDPWPPDRGRRRPGTTSLDCHADRGRSEKTLFGLVSEDPGWTDLDRFVLTQGLPAEPAAVGPNGKCRSCQS
jgi:hypothetical protein